MYQIVQELSHSLATIHAALDTRRIIEDAIAIQQIPAPTFDERQRAAYIQDRFARLRLHNVEIDSIYNVYGRWPGLDPARPALLVSAHTDTVFPLETDLAIRREDGKIHGPGLGDNSLGVAGLLALMDVLRTYDLRAASDIWFVADSREEGLGDLGGIRAAWQKLGSNLGAAIVVEGMAFGRIYHAGIAVRRLHVTCHAPGGHSWLHFGKPSAIHGLIGLGAQIIAFKLPEQPRTTYNIGLIQGGHSVNSLAASAEMYLDLRSETPDTLAALEEQVMTAMDSLQRPGLEFTAAVVGSRPAGQIGIDHPLVQLATAALETAGYKPAYETGSTDANALLARGLPTVTVGVTHGGNSHRLDEYIETAPVADGLWQLILLVLAAADHLHTWQGDR